MNKHLGRIFLLLILLAAAIVLHRTNFLPRTLAWISGLGWWGPAVFVLVYAASCVFFVPSVVFTFSGGVLFGLAKGFWLSLIGGGAGALAAFWIGRTLAHDFVEKKISGRDEFQRLARAVRTKGWKIIFLARLSPVFPFLIGNYAFGTTRIPALHYLWASLAGTIPTALVYSYLGSLTRDLAVLEFAGRPRTAPEWALIIAGLSATVVLTWYLRRVARKDLDQDLRQ